MESTAEVEIRRRKTTVRGILWIRVAAGSLATFDSIRDKSALRPSKLTDRSQQWHCGCCQQVGCFK